MDSLVLIDGELRSLLRNAFERIIGKNFKKKYNNYLDIVIKLAIRVVSSLIAVQLFKNIRTLPNINRNVSYIMIVAFFFYYNKEQENLINVF